jgi:hypothetical protein
MESAGKPRLTSDEIKAEKEMNEARRKTIRDMLYRKES